MTPCQHIFPAGEEHPEISWNLTVPTPNIYMIRISVLFGWADLDGDREDESHPEL
jgi:hypothetical protein